MNYNNFSCDIAFPPISKLKYYLIPIKKTHKKIPCSKIVPFILKQSI